MSLALVHIHPDDLTVLGVWLSPTSSAYLRTKDGGAARTLGHQIMDSRGSGPTWNEWARHLSEKTPTVAVWQAVPRSDGEEPRHVLARAVAQEAVARRKQAPEG